jgi:excisionase family DNA binding protein
MSEDLSTKKDLLSVDEVAEYLGVGSVTIWRWCREESLPCLKIGRSWRIRREVLEEFLRKSERPATLAGRLRSFLEVPDDVLAIAQNRELLHRLDAAFFQAGEARGGRLVKYYRDEQEGPMEEVRANLEREGLEMTRLEEEGRFHLISEGDSLGGRLQELKQLLSEERGSECPVWINFNWEERIDLDKALKQQEEITESIEDTLLVVKTSVLEQILDDWLGATQRQAQVFHSGTVWLSEAGFALSRVVPPLG